MLKSKKILSIGVASLLFSNIANADMYDKLNIDSESFSGVDQSMSSIYQMGKIPVKANRSIFEYTNSKMGNYRKTILALNLMATKFVINNWQALFVHEHAHLTGKRSIGIGQTYADKHPANGWARFFKWGATFQEGGGKIWAGAKTSGAFENDEIDPFDGTAEDTVGGFNSQQVLANQQGEQARLTNSIHSADMINYLMNRTSFLSYAKGPEGDRDQVVDMYKTGTRGYNDPKNGRQTKTDSKWKYDIQDSDIVYAESISLMLSATTYNYIFASLNYLDTGNPVSKLKLHKIGNTNFVYPDTEFYMSSRGLSYRLAMGYKVNKNTYIPFSYEKVTKGQTDVSEFGIGVDHTFKNNLNISSKIFSASGEISSRNLISYGLDSGIDLYTDLQMLNWKGMDSRRYLYNTKGKAKDYRVMFGVSIPFNKIF